MRSPSGCPTSPRRAARARAARRRPSRPGAARLHGIRRVDRHPAPLPEAGRLRVDPWLLGRNLGSPNFVRERLVDRAAELYARYERKVTIIGWSWAGSRARDRQAHATRVRQVITLGSPFGDVASPTSLSRFFEYASGRDLSSEMPEQVERIRARRRFPRRRSTARATASRTGGSAARKRVRAARTSRSPAATAASAGTHWSCGRSPTGSRRRKTTGSPSSPAAGSPTYTNS